MRTQQRIGNLKIAEANAYIGKMRPNANATVLQTDVGMNMLLQLRHNQLIQFLRIEFKINRNAGYDNHKEQQYCCQ